MSEGRILTKFWPARWLEDRGEWAGVEAEARRKATASTAAHTLHLLAGSYRVDARQPEAHHEVLATFALATLDEAALAEFLDAASEADIDVILRLDDDRVIAYGAPVGAASRAAAQ